MAPKDNYFQVFQMKHGSLKCVTILFLLPLIQFSHADLQLQTIFEEYVKPFLHENLNEPGIPHGISAATYTSASPSTTYTTNPYENKNQHLANPTGHTNVFEGNQNYNLGSYNTQDAVSGNIQRNVKEIMTSNQFDSVLENQNNNYVHQQIVQPLISNHFEDSPTNNSAVGVQINVNSINVGGSHQQQLEFKNDNNDKISQTGNYNQQAVPLVNYAVIALQNEHHTNNERINNPNNRVTNKNYVNSNGQNLNNALTGQSKSVSDTFSGAHSNQHEKQHRNKQPFLPEIQVVENIPVILKNPSQDYNTNNQNYKGKNIYLHQTPELRVERPVGPPEIHVIRSKSIPVLFKDPYEKNNNNDNNYNVVLPEITVPNNFNIPIHVMDNHDKRPPSASQAKIELIPISNPSPYSNPSQPLIPVPEQDKKEYSTLITTSSLLPPLRYEDQTTSVEYYPVRSSYHQNKNALSHNSVPDSRFNQQNSNGNNYVEPEYPSLIIKKDKQDFDFTGLLTSESVNKDTTVGLTNSNSGFYPSPTDVITNQGKNLDLPNFTSFQDTKVEPIKSDTVWLSQGSNHLEQVSSFTPTPASTSTLTRFNTFTKYNNGASNSVNSPTFIQPSSNLTPTPSLYTISNPLTPYLNYEFQKNTRQINAIQSNQKPPIVNSIEDKYNYPDLTWQTYTPTIFNNPVLTQASKTEVKTTPPQITSSVPSYEKNSNSHYTSFKETQTNQNNNFVSKNEIDTNQQNKHNSEFTIFPSIQLELMPPAPLQVAQTNAIEPTSKPTHSIYPNSISGLPGLNGPGSGSWVNSDLNKNKQIKYDDPLNIRHNFPGLDVIPASATHFEQHQNHLKFISSYTPPGWGKRWRPRKSRKTEGTNNTISAVSNPGVKTANREKKGTRKTRKIRLDSLINVHKNRLSNVRSVLRQSVHDWPLHNLRTMSNDFYRSASKFYGALGNQRARVQRFFEGHLHSRSRPLSNLRHHPKNMKANRVKRRHYL